MEKERKYQIQRKQKRKRKGKKVDRVLQNWKEKRNQRCNH